MVIVNVDRLPLLIIYSILAGLSTLFLIYYIIRLRGMANRVKKIESKLVRRGYRIGKYVLKAASIGIAIYEIVSLETSQTMILLTALSTVVLVFNIISEIVIIYIDAAIDRLMLAFYMDREQNVLNKLISGDLNRQNYIIANEEELREKIKKDKDTYIKPMPEPVEKDPWYLRKAKSFITKQINRRVNSDEVEVIDDDKRFKK